MILAGVFGLVLFLLLIIGDWYQFTNLYPSSARYGYGLVQRKESPLEIPFSDLPGRFDQQGHLPLPHGIARLFHDQQVIVIRPYYQLFTTRFRTAWPLKGTIEVVEEGERLPLKLIKRIPWSSALITMSWLAIVSLGTVGFIIAFAINGGFGSASGVLMGLGVVGLGVLVLAFGLVMVSLAYRLEDQRLMQVYQELREALVLPEHDPA